MGFWLGLGLVIVLIILVGLVGAMGFFGPGDNDRRGGGGSFIDWML